MVKHNPIPPKQLVQARIRPDLLRELERRAAARGMRLCTYVAHEIERFAALKDDLVEPEKEGYNEPGGGVE